MRYVRTSTVLRGRKFHSKFHKVIKYLYYTYILTVIMIYGNLAKKSEWVVSHEHKNIIQYYRVRPTWLPDTCTLLVLNTVGHYTTLSYFLVLPKRQFLWLSPEMWLRNSYLKYTISVIYSYIHYPTVLNFWRKFHSQIYGGWNFSEISQ